MLKKPIAEDHGGWVLLDISTDRWPGVMTKVSRIDLPRIEPFNLLPSSKGGRAKVVLGNGNTPPLGAWLHGFKGFTYYVNGDVLDNRRGNVVKCPNKVESSTGGVLTIPIPSKARPDDKMLIEASEWVRLLSLGIGRVSSYRQPHRYVSYAITNLNSKSVRVHRLILPNAEEIDHINRDGLDNRLCNLRSCTMSENNLNRRVWKSSKSGKTGVTPHKSTGKWEVRIGIKGKVRNLGLYASLEEAISVREKAEIELLGATIHH